MFACLLAAMIVVEYVVGVVRVAVAVAAATDDFAAVNSFAIVPVDVAYSLPIVFWSFQ